MKIFILWDMEGTSGLFTREQTWYWERDARAHVGAEGRRLLMEDANSASAAALAAGADELIVCDTHHGGGNIEVDKMLADPRITYLRRSVGPENGKFRYMPGLDRTVDGFMLLGHHAKAGTEGAFLPHTNSLAWADVRINGQSVGEIGLETRLAGHWDVPLVLVQGDEATCTEVREQFSDAVTACVKRAVSRDLCAGLDAESARRLTAAKVAEAIAKVRTDKPRPYKTTLPMTVTIRMTSVAAAEKVAARPGVQRIDEYTVKSRAEQQCDMLKWLDGTGLDMPLPQR